MREDHYQNIFRFRSGLRSDIQHAMLTSSYHVNSIEEAFHLALVLELSFKRISIFRAREQCFKCEGHRHYDYHCPLKSRHVNIVSSNGVDDSRVVEDVYVPFEIISVVEDTLVNSSTPIIDEVHVSSEGTSDVEDALMKSNIPISDDIYVHDMILMILSMYQWSLECPHMLLGIHLPHL